MKYKIRKLAMEKNGEVIEFNYSLTVPKEVVMFLGSDTKFTVSRDGSSIIYTSGTTDSVTETEAGAFKFE